MTKLKLIKPKKAVLHNRDDGIVFGHGYDIGICNKCNVEEDLELQSYADIGYSYNDSKKSFKWRYRVSGNDYRVGVIGQF